MAAGGPGAAGAASASSPTPTSPTRDIRFAIDRGGTFTDVFAEVGAGWWGVPLSALVPAIGLRVGGRRSKPHTLERTPHVHTRLPQVPDEHGVYRQRCVCAGAVLLL